MLKARSATTESRTSRATRVEMYADWLEHDADGLAFNLATPAGQSIPDATVILANARDKLARALEQIERAIAADEQSHNETEPA